MAFVVETGSGSATSNSYASVAVADAYVANRGITGWGSLSSTVKEQSLIKATDYLEATYRSSWRGTRVTSTQALSWPRWGVEADAFAVPSDIVPVAVVNACVEMALKALSGDLINDETPRVIREQVDVISVEYSEFGISQTQYTAVNRTLAPYLLATFGSGFSQMRVERT